jgi:hypothetical protein
MGDGSQDGPYVKNFRLYEIDNISNRPGILVEEGNRPNGSNSPTSAFLWVDVPTRAKSEIVVSQPQLVPSLDVASTLTVRPDRSTGLPARQDEVWLDDRVSAPPPGMLEDKELDTFAVGVAFDEKLLTAGRSSRLRNLDLLFSWNEDEDNH